MTILLYCPKCLGLQNFKVNAVGGANCEKCGTVSQVPKDYGKKKR